MIIALGSCEPKAIFLQKNNRKEVNMAEEKIIRVVEFGLLTDQSVIDSLNKRMKLACDIYNDLNNFYQRKLRNLTTSKAWVNNNKALAREYRKLEEQTGKKKKTKTLEIKELLDERNTTMRSYGFSEFDFISNIAQFSSKYAKNISSNMSADIARRLWSSYEKLFFGNGTRVHFKKREEFNSIASNGKSGIRVSYDEKGWYIILSNSRAKAIPLKIYLKKPRTDYDDYMLRQLETFGVKVIRIVRRIEKNKPKFYVQFTIQCDDNYDKVDRKTGEVKHIYNLGNKVAINLYRNWLICVTEDGIKHFDLTNDYETHHAKLTVISQQMDEIKRSLNPDNFNEDGTIKPGIMVDGKRQKLKWVTNYEYRTLRKQLKELHRNYATNLKLNQRKMVYEILKLGTDITIYDTNFAYKLEKDEWDPENIPPQGEMRKKARERRSIAHGAPAQLITYLNMRLSMLGLDEVKKVRVSDDVFWYKHDTDASDEAAFKGGMVRIGNVEVESLLYHAFVLYFYEPTTESLNKKEMKKNFSKYFR